MLLIAIPTGQAAGPCQVDGEPCEFRVHSHSGEFWFRPSGGGRWDKRKILGEVPAGAGQTGYACGPGRAFGQAAPKVFGRGVAGDELSRLVETHDALFRRALGKLEPGGCFLFGDLRNPDVFAATAASAGRAMAEAFRRSATEAGARPMVVIPREPGFLAALLADLAGDTGDEGGETIRAMAAIRSLLDGPPADSGLPVLFLSADDLEVTTWSPDARPQPATADIVAFHGGK